MKIATFNINGIRSRLPRLLDWLAREAPDVVCLQELKASQEQFPERQIVDAGYQAIWHGQRAWNGVAILSRSGLPLESRRGLPRDPDSTQSRYIEAAVDGVIVGCLYLPNGNPQPGPKFDYKLAWFERFIAHAQTLWSSGHPVVLAGDYNVVPTDFDIYNTRSWLKDALLQPESRECYSRLLAQGWTDAIRTLHPDERIYTFWDYFRQHWQTNSGLRIDHLLLSASLALRLQAAGVDRWVRGETGASDHAPTWITLADAGATQASIRVAKKAPAKAAAAKKTVAKKTVAKKPVAKKTVAKTPAATKATKKMPQARASPAKARTR